MTQIFCNSDDIPHAHPEVRVCTFGLERRGVVSVTSSSGESEGLGERDEKVTVL